MFNTFGIILSITTFGESHGPAIGVVVDGLPAGLPVDVAAINAALDRRKPGQSHITTQRIEADTATILSGVFDGVSLGSPIAITIANQDQRPRDYDVLKTTFRPGHADFTYFSKYGVRDYRGGGRASARETAARVAAAALVDPLLNSAGIKVWAYTSQIGDIKVPVEWTGLLPSLVDSNVVRCPDAATAIAMEALILATAANEDTIGGTITCVAEGVPVGLGEPIYHKLSAALASAMLGINAAKGFDMGRGFDGLSDLGSQQNDTYSYSIDGIAQPDSNHAGGMHGGISNGAPIYFRVAFKPVSTIRKPQQALTESGEITDLEVKGRHDPCVIPRAVPIVEAMAKLVLADYLLLSGTRKVTQ